MNELKGINTKNTELNLGIKIETRSQKLEDKVESLRGVYNLMKSKNEHQKRKIEDAEYDLENLLQDYKKLKGFPGNIG